jgi:hypothetical protein
MAIKWSNYAESVVDCNLDPLMLTDMLYKLPQPLNTHQPNCVRKHMSQDPTFPNTQYAHKTIEYLRLKIVALDETLDAERVKSSDMGEISEFSKENYTICNVYHTPLAAV